MRVRVGIDTGGTFTDVVVCGPDGETAAKVPSTPGDPSKAFQAALHRMFGESRTPCDVRHGTTVGTNTVLTRSGARVAFVTTAGLDGLLAIGRGERRSLHTLQPERLAPLVTARRTFAVPERLDALGRVVTPLTADFARSLVERIAKSGAESVAITLLHATRNDAHEKKVLRALRKMGKPISVSSAISAEPSEVERAVTTVLDAYVAPAIGQYVSRIRDGLPDYVHSLHIMRSDGGRMTADAVLEAPVRTLLSGPAAGVAAAADWARRLQLQRAVSFDMGGTSTDVAWIEDGHAQLRPEVRVGPWRAGVSSIAIETVGAGGGSVVAVDAGGALRVGPESAGADPGPASYGRGGPLTVTDVWLARGQVPGALADGTVALDLGCAASAAGAMAKRAQMSVRTFLRGASQVAATATAAAVRKASAERGHDPQGATLIAFGGAGPVQACEAAEVLGIRHVVVPPNPGALAAAGTLVVPLRADAEATCRAEEDATQLRSMAAALRARVREALRGQGGRAPQLTCEIEARFEGQAYAITLPFDRTWRARFRETHEARYGFGLPGAVEPVRLRVRGDARDGQAGPAQPPVTTARPRRSRTVKEGVIAREDVGGSSRVRGPVRIEEPTATTWVPSGWSAYVDALACLHIVVST